MTKRYIYGPVPSRRLGYSLGVDLVPYKVCPYNCIYCQLGRTRETTIERKPYIPAAKILEQVYEKLNEGLEADFITLAGSGEPTLNSEIDRVIQGIKERTEIPVTVLTNGAVLWDPQVRQDIMGADVIINAAREDPVQQVLQATSGSGADIVVECAGVSASLHQTVEMVRGGIQQEKSIRGRS